MTTKPFGALTELGQARRLRPLAIEALASYDLEWTGLRLLSNGWNCVLRVDTTDGPRVLRITRPVPGAFDRSVASEVEFMSALSASADVAVPAVVANHAGGLVTLAAAEGVPEARECVVFGWLGGPNLAAQRSAATWAALGELLGKMHRFAEDWTPSDDFWTPRFESCMPYGEPLVVLEPGKAELYGLGDMLRQATDLTNERITALNREVPSIVVHGDLHQWNVKIRRGVLSPFDFEDLLWAAPVLDVATSLYYVRHDDDYRKLAAAFRSGYERQRDWVEREPGEVDRLMFARSLLLLNTVALDDSFDLGGDTEAFVRRREVQALVALGRAEAVEIGS
jgi:Ser/Thr protein kinase RdoA (MazF antagonist)